MTHRYHPDLDRDDPETAIVYDDCERCDASTQHPYRLDFARLHEAYLRAQEDDWSGTKNERRLFERLYQQRLLNERLRQIGVL